MKKTIFYSLFICFSLGVAGLLLIGATKPDTIAISSKETQSPTSHAFEHCSSIQAYHDVLEEEEQALWQNIQTTCNISYDTVASYKKQWHKEYVAMEQSLYDEYQAYKLPAGQARTLIEEVIKDFGLSPDTIKIMGWQIPSVAGSTDNALFIHEKFFAPPMPARVQKFIIAHEIIHILQHDHSTEFIIRMVLSQKSQEEQKAGEAVLHDLGQLCETRADILASLHNQEYAQGQSLLMQQRIKQAKNDPTGDHPPYATRLTISNNILALNKKTLNT